VRRNICFHLQCGRVGRQFSTLRIKAAGLSNVDASLPHSKASRDLNHSVSDTSTLL
jgi:hypothetical protein